MIKRIVSGELKEIVRGRLSEVARRLSTGDGLESLSGRTHIPAPEIHKPTVSPLTQLGTKPPEEQPITRLGDAPKEVEEPRVITWLGDKSEDRTKEEHEASEERQRLMTLERKRLAYPQLMDLPLGVMPSFVRRRKSEIRDPLSIDDAVQKLLEIAPREDGTVTIRIWLRVDPRKSNQFVRGICNLPHGTGKQLRIVVFAEGSEAQKAKEEAVDIVGSTELIQEITESEGKKVEDIDICVATPVMMTKGLAKLGRILGPRGLMPNPKAGTLTNDVTEAIRKLRGGQIEFRVDRNGMLNSRLGRVNFGIDKLLQNTAAYGRDVMDARPEMFEGKAIEEFMQRITVAATNAVAIPVDMHSFQTLLTTA